MEAPTATATENSKRSSDRNQNGTRMKSRLSRKQILWIAAGAVLLLAIVYGLMPEPVTVQTASVERGPLQVVVEEEGETRVMEHFVVTAPVAGYMRRIELEVGDPIGAGQVLVQLEAPRAADLDPRTRAEMAARIEGARALVAQSADRARAAAAAAERAVEERDRIARLVEGGAATPQALERAEGEAEQAVAAREAARATVAAAQSDLAAAEAALRPAAEEAPVRQTIRAPAAGRVLAIHRRSSGHVNPGEPIIEIGDTSRLEVLTEVLSQDAVRIPHGARVMIDEWGGEIVLEGIVERIEPRAVTRVSALGVEEQRVQVVSALTSPVAEWTPLGSGYRVLSRFVIWEGEDVLQVPTGALFRVEGRWAVFIVEGGRAWLREVGVGRQTGLSAQIVSGLERGDVVVVHPDDRIAEGVRVAAR